MKTLETMFTEYMDMSYEAVELIEPNLYLELRKAYYSGFARCGRVYENDILEVPEELVSREISLLKSELLSFAEYLDMVYTQIVEDGNGKQTGGNDK